MRRKGVWGRQATSVNPRLSLGIFVLITITVIYFGAATAQSGPASPQAEFDGQLSAECQSPLYQELATISVHTDDPRLAENIDLLRRCNAQLNKVVSRSATRMMARTIAPLEGLINFETPHVHPIDLTPNGNTLLAVNIAAHMLEVYQVSGNQLVHLESVPVGLDPVSVRARTNSEAWVVNHLSDSVSIVDLTTGTVVQTLATDNEPADVVFAGTPQRAFVSASEADAINVFDLSNLNAAPQTIDIFGEDPRALAVSNDGQTVYAAVFESGNNTRVQGSGGSATIARGNTLADNDVAIINANTLALSFQTGLMTMNMALDVHPTTNNITVVGTEALNDILLEPNVNAIFLRVNMASFPQGGNTAIIDLNPHLTYNTTIVPQATRNLSIGDPRGIAWRSNGSQAFITGMGSNNVIVIDSAGGRVDNIEVGQGPTGIVLNDSANLGYVMNKFDGTISILNLNTRQEIDTVAFDDPTPAVIKNGRPFLYDTHATSGLGHVSCASCHVDARTDRLAWDLGVPGGGTFSIPEVSNSLPGALTGNNVTVSALKGPMVTQTLQDIMEHPRLHWRGDRANLGEFNPAFENLMGDDAQLSSAEMQAFGDFLATIWLPPNPYRNLDDSRPTSVVLPDGRTVTTAASLDALRGNNPTNNNCLACHSGQGNATRNFGANAEIGSNIIAPALPGIYDKMGFGRGTAGFGFFHTGEANIDRASRLSTSEQNEAFLAELMTLGGPSGPLTGAELRQIPHAGVGQQVTINSSPSTAQNNLLNQFKSISASSPFAVLIAKAKLNGTQRGFVYLGSDNFQSDRQAEQTTLAQLLAAAAAGDPVTFMLVADGMETRLALDSDLDGTFNGDEVLRLDNPGDQSNNIGDTVALQMVALDPNSSTLTFSASDLPTGLSINSGTGLISGSPTTAGAFLPTVTVANTLGESVNVSFAWTVVDPTLVLISADFNSSTDSFAYIDDAFRNTSQPAYADGNRNATAGELTVTLGGIDNDDILGMSGGWQRTFNVAAPTTVNFSIRYNLTHDNQFESDEFSQILVAVDGALLGANGNDFVAQINGDGQATTVDDTTGWQTFATSVTLSAGSHTLTIGGYGNKKTFADEVITIQFDDVSAIADPPTNQAPTLTAPGDQTNTVGDAVDLTIVGSDPDGDTLTFNSSGLPTGLAITADGRITGSPAVAGSYSVLVWATDGNGGSDAVGFNWTIEAGNTTSCTNGVLHEWWDDIPGYLVPDLVNSPNYPNQPSGSNILPALESPGFIKDSYGVRLRGYIVAPATGQYTFWIASDDSGELWLSTDESDANATRIATVPGWTFAEEYEKYPDQQSAIITLTAGQRYYVEALMKEWFGGDHLSVAWQTPLDSTRTLITDADLCAFELSGTPPVANLSSDVTSGDAPLTVNFDATGSTDADGSISSYAWEFGDGSTASGSTVSHTYVNGGVYDVTLIVTDNDGRTDSASTTITANVGNVACPQAGLTYERYDNIFGPALGNLLSDPRYPDAPPISQIVSDFEAPSNVDDYYGARLHGYIVAPVSGSYTFWIASDDAGSLRLSSDSNPSNAVQIASVSAWAPQRQWDWYPEQQSAPISLTAGETYYVEALVKENGGGDNLAVAWQIPGGTRQLIPSVVLCPAQNNGSAPNAVLNANPITGDAPLSVNFDGSASSDADGAIASYSWAFGDGNSASGATVNHVYTNAGSYIAELTVTDGDGRTDTATVSIVVTTPGGGVACNTNGVRHELWTNVWSDKVADLQADLRYPDSPDNVSTLTDFVVPSNVGDIYGARMRAYLIAPETGSYTFWVASDNDGQLWLSSDINPGNATMIGQTHWSPEQGWDHSGSQKSAEISLVAGEAYYIEGLHQASWGGDYFAAAWDTPSGPREVIPNDALCIIETTRATHDMASIGQTLDVLTVEYAVPQFGASQLVASLPAELYPEVMTILAGDQRLRADLFALADELEQLLTVDGMISAEYVEAATAAYDAFYAQASPQLQAWLAHHWSRINPDSMTQQSARNAWQVANTLTPTSVQLERQAANDVNVTPLLIVFTLLLIGSIWRGFAQRQWRRKE